MNEHTLGSNFTLSRFVSHRCATGKFLFCFLSLLFFAILIGGAVAAADVSSAQTFSLGPNLSFSVADFDGDSRPDLASVQAGTSNALSAGYWIQLQVSAAGRQTFRIVAPMGGIQIASGDVNGDNVLDLILSTTWLEQPVAILLNNGHGTFSRVAPEAFPEAFREYRASWCSTTEHATDVVSAPPRSREDICSEIGSFHSLRTRSRIASSDPRLTVRPFLISHCGRAPPSEVSHS